MDESIVIELIDNLCNYDTKLEGLLELKRNWPKQFQPQLDRILRDYVESTAEPLIPESDEDQHKLIDSIPGFKAVTTHVVLKAIEQKEDATLVACLVVYALALTQTSYGMSPWRSVLQLVPDEVLSGELTT